MVTVLEVTDWAFFLALVLFLISAGLEKGSTVRRVLVATGALLFAFSFIIMVAVTTMVI
jgi:uncharacterized transporter YbjL